MHPSPSARVVRCLFYERDHLLCVAHASSTIVALAQAPFHSSHTPDASFLLSAGEFFEETALIAATLQSRTQKRYAVALENFRSSSFASLPAALPLDHRLCMYIQDCLTQNSRPRHCQELANLVCMILIIYPALRGN